MSSGSRRWDGEIEWDASIPPNERLALESNVRERLAGQIHGIDRVRVSGRRTPNGGWDLKFEFL